MSSLIRSSNMIAALLAVSSMGVTPLDAAASATRAPPQTIPTPPKPSGLRPIDDAGLAKLNASRARNRRRNIKRAMDFRRQEAGKRGD